MLFIPVVLLVNLAMTACVSGVATSAGHDLTMASLSPMPGEVKAAPVVVQQAYQFAAANPDVLRNIPCYCGCRKLGHKSNYDCYLKNADASKPASYDLHALGCSICVDITQDTMRLLRAGQNVQQIKAYVDGVYARYGPSNMSQ